MNEDNQLRGSRSVPPPDLETSNETNAAGRPDRSRTKICRILGKVTNGVIKKISRSNLKNSRNREPVFLDVDSREGTPSVPNNELQHTSLGVEEFTDLQSAIRDAKENTKGMNVLSGRVASGVSATQNTPADLEDACNFEDTYLRPLKIFDTVIQALADVHPYAKIALGVLSGAAKIILAQVDRDKAILSLLKKLGEVYSFISDYDRLRQLSSMRAVLGNISQQTLQCAHFIRDYSKIKSFWKRLGKNLLKETDDAIRQFNKVLDHLMNNFQKQVILDTNIHVHHIVETVELSDMTYASGAGLDLGKQCLPDTRTTILSQITDWANSTGGDVPRVLWLSGPAGTGKSTIAHTIAKWFKDAGGLGSCYCFDRQEQADHRHQKIFSTIARDLAGRDPELKRALADAIEDDGSLKKTTDIIQQWDELLMKPLGKLSEITIGPVVIVIDALDESGGVEIRRRILHILAGKLGNPSITTLPVNLRIIVTSRPLRDIEDELGGVQHIRQMSMDSILPAEAKNDINAYVSDKLGKLSDFRDVEIAALAEKADGLFEWARLAWEYITDTLPGLSPMDRYKSVMARDPAERKDLLYDLYDFILAELIPQAKCTPADYQRALARFRSVMGQILGAAKPLPLASLNDMRDYFPDQDDHYKVELVVKSMGPLLSGTTSQQFPIRPLHASFGEFLTGSSCKREFLVDMSKAQRDLAFASLQVMKHLHFNMCDLKSSYLPNCDDPELQERVNTFSPHLSYSCLFWASHVQGAQFASELANEIKLFLNHQRSLFWLEVLGLMNAINDADTSLAIITQWLKNGSGYEDVLFTVMDFQNFIQTFGGIISHSTPHLYVSALPFSPVNSEISRKLATRFPNALRLTSDRPLDWAAIQIELNWYAAVVTSVSFSPDQIRIVSGLSDGTIRLWDTATGQPVIAPIRGRSGRILSVAFSPDRTRIVTASAHNTIRVWDAATGLPIGEPLQGHTSSVLSVEFSPDGTRIVSGSADETVRVWDAGTRQPLHEPFRGHTSSVSSVAFSPDGTRIVSGSADGTVRVWDAGTGQPLGEPFIGHTSSVSSVEFSLDGTRIVSGSADNTVRVWDAATGQPLGEPFRGHTSSVFSVAFSPDGTHIISGSADNTVRLWDAGTGLPVGEPFEGHTSDVLSVTFSPDGTLIASASTDGTIRLWDATTAQTNQFIRFSSNSTHALYNPAKLIEGSRLHDHRSTSFSLGVNGWMTGPDRQLLFWVPPALRQPFYTPKTVLVIPRGNVELDLSRMAHGERWSSCRDESPTEG